MRKTAYLFFWLLVLSSIALPPVGLAQDQRFFTVNNVRARPLAMGGAFTSVEDNLAAINFNPASFSLYESEKNGRLTLFLNPVGLVVGGIENSDIFDAGFNLDDFLLSLSLLVKSAFVSFRSFDLGVLLGEQTLNLPREFANEDIFNVTGMQQNHSHSLVGRLRLAEKISLGGMASVFQGSRRGEPRERIRDVGLSYGILLKPEKELNVGVAFISLPDSLEDTRWPVERMADESVNIGVSYRPFEQTTLSVDVRNLGEEQNRAVREFHVGFEQVVFSQLALRGGFYRKQEEGQFVVSGGVGLWDGNSLFAQENRFASKNFLLNYSFVYENREVTDRLWHLLSFMFRI